MTTCAACGATGQPEGARFCFSCGAPTAAPPCGSCGADLVAGARFCSSCGAVQGAETAGGPVSARRVTSVLFGDLVGFTSLSETRDQEDVRELLSRYFEECRRIISRYGGTVEKFIGDAVMAVWGVPTTHEDDAERAVRAGLELIDVVTSIGDQVGVPDLAMRVGIVTGEVAVTVGAQQQGMVAGDAVNTAARVQSAATPGQVWVDETTRLLTSSAISFVDVGSHAMKGKADPVPLWAVRAVVANVGGGQRADGLEAPHVGRDRELRVVKELFHGVEEGRRPAMLVVSGEPGIGKSRLAWEFEKYLDGLSTNVRWHSGRCLSYGEGVAFYALAEAVRGRLQVLSVDDETSDDDQARLLARGLDHLITDPDERAWLEPRMAALLGIGAVGQFQREDLFTAWATFLERVGLDDRPVLLVVDDAQHVDDGLVAFLEHVTAVGAFPLFVVLLARPSLLEDRPTLATNRRTTVLHLETLQDAEMAHLLDGLVAGLPDDVRTGLVERAEGVPLYAVETVRSLIDRDLVLPRGGQYVLVDQALDLDAIGAPASLHALMSARLDALPADQRRVVDVASVLGTTFTRSQIEALCPDVDLDGVLAGLVRAQVLRQESDRLSAERGQYQFVQSAVRQVAVGTLSRRDRKALHLAVAALVEASDKTVGELSSIVAQHLIEAADAVDGADDVAELTEAAVSHLRRAATRAGSLGATGEAAGHLEVALARTVDPGIRREVEADLAAYLQRSGRYEESMAHAVAARDAFDEAGDLVSAGGAVVTLVRALGLGLGRFEDARREVREWTARLTGAPGTNHVLLGLALVHTTLEVRMAGDTIPPAAEAVRLAALVGTPAQVAESYLGLGIAYQVSGIQGPGEVLVEAATRMAREARDLRVLVRALMNCCALKLCQDAPSAVEFGREALDIAATLGEKDWLEATVANLSIALLAVGDWDELASLSNHVETTTWSTIFSLMQSEADLARDRQPEWPVDSHDPSLVYYSRVAQARAAIARGTPEEAGDLALEGARLALDMTGFYDDFNPIFTIASDVARACGPEVTRSLLAIIPSPDEVRPPVGVRASAALETAWLASQDDEPADDLFQTALTLHEEWGAHVRTARAHADYGTWLTRAGRAEEAETHLAAAREAFERFGAARWFRVLEEQLVGVRV